MALKPTSPLKLNNQEIYPLTSSDQIILPDGSHWDADAPISIGGGRHWGNNSFRSASEFRWFTYY